MLSLTRSDMAEKMAAVLRVAEPGEPMRIVLLFGLVLLLDACSVQWVKLTPQGENVAVLKENEVSNCTPNGSTTIGVPSKVIIERNEAKVQEELKTLARNNAADQGDAIVPAGPAKNGRQTYNIYRCRR